MIKAAAIICCFVSFLAVLFVVAGTSQSGDVEAKETKLLDDGCSMRELALDQGYGVTRTISQRICAHRE